MKFTKNVCKMSEVFSLCLVCVLMLSSCYRYYIYRFNPEVVSVHDWEIDVFASFREGGKNMIKKPSNDPEIRERQYWHMNISFKNVSLIASNQVPELENIAVLYSNSGKRTIIQAPIRRTHRFAQVMDYSYSIDSLALPDTNDNEFDLSFDLQLIDSVTQDVTLDTTLKIHAKLDRHSEVWVGH